MARIFGTDGIRGRFGREPLTPSTLRCLGAASARALSSNASSIKARAPKRVLIGRDTRASGPEILAALTAGLRAEDVAVFDLGIITTPGVAYCVRNLGAMAGIVISASHNPARDNGVKFFGPDGFKLDDQVEDAIESIMDEVGEIADLQHQPEDATEHAQAYFDHLVSNAREYCKQELPLAGVKLVVDCANGAASEIAPRVFTQLGADVIGTHCKPDGNNINADCGATHPDVLAASVKEHDADAGVTFDGDADRLQLASSNGSVLDGDFMLAALGQILREKGSLHGNAVVSTVMANLGLENALKERDIKLHRTRVGDRYVVAEMLQSDNVLGGEQSGHIIHLNRASTTGDGIFNAVSLLSHYFGNGRDLSEMESLVTKAPQVLINVRVRAQPVIADVPRISKAIAGAEARMGERGRVVVRYSGTEPLARVMVEGLDADEIQREAEIIANVFREDLGAPDSIRREAIQ